MWLGELSAACLIWQSCEPMLQGRLSQYIRWNPANDEAGLRENIQAGTLGQRLTLRVVDELSHFRDREKIRRLAHYLGPSACMCLQSAGTR